MLRPRVCAVTRIALGAAELRSIFKIQNRCLAMIRGGCQLAPVCPTPLPRIETCSKRDQNDKDRARSYRLSEIALSLFLKELLSNVGKLAITRRAVLNMCPNRIVESNLAVSQRLKDS